MARATRAFALTIQALIVTGILCSCGTLCNLAGIQPPDCARRGPYLGEQVAIPQAAFLGGSRFDVAVASAMVRTKSVEIGGGFGRYETIDLQQSGCTWLWWFYILLVADVPVSFAGDLLLSPVTGLITDPDPRRWPEAVRPSP